MGEEEAEKRADFWLKISGITFGLWSLAIPVGVYIVKDSVNDVVQAQKVFNSQFSEYVLGMERRVTLIEERQSVVITKLRMIEEDHRAAFGNGSKK
jgi:hypothetical protein